MTINQNLIAIALLSLGANAFGQNIQDDLKERVLAQAKGLSADEYAFTRTTRTDQTTNGKTERKVAVEKFDPSKPAEARWTLVSVDGAAPSADDLNSFRKGTAKRRVPGYYRLAGYFGTPATVSTDARGRVVFHFAALPKDSVIALDTDVFQNAAVDATVNGGGGLSFVEQVHTTVKPMRLKLIAKLESYDSTSRYRLGPEGKPVLIEQIADLSGSGMGQKGKAHIVITYTDYRVVSVR